MLKEFFIGRVCDVEVQRQLIKANENNDNTLKLALECEKRASNSAQFQSLLFHNTQPSSITMVKQEPTFSIQSGLYSSRSRGGSAKPTSKQGYSSNYSKSCYFCGDSFSLEHRKLCPANEVACKLCKKRGHFANCYKSSKKKAKIVREDEGQTSSSILKDYGFIDEPEHDKITVEDVIQIKASDFFSLSPVNHEASAYNFLFKIVFYSTVDTIIFRSTYSLQKNPNFIHLRR